MVAQEEVLTLEGGNVVTVGTPGFPYGGSPSFIWVFVLCEDTFLYL